MRQQLSSSWLFKASRRRIVTRCTILSSRSRHNPVWLCRTRRTGQTISNWSSQHSCWPRDSGGPCKQRSVGTQDSETRRAVKAYCMCSTFSQLDDRLLCFAWYEPIDSKCCVFLSKPSIRSRRPHLFCQHQLCLSRCQRTQRCSIRLE